MTAMPGENAMTATAELPSAASAQNVCVQGGPAIAYEDATLPAWVSVKWLASAGVAIQVNERGLSRHELLRVAETVEESAAPATASE